MLLQRVGSGEIMIAKFSTEHAASSYGIPVLVVDGIAMGPADVSTFRLVEATPEEIAEIGLRRFRFAK